MFQNLTCRVLDGFVGRAAPADQLVLLQRRPADGLHCRLVSAQLVQRLEVPDVSDQQLVVVAARSQLLVGEGKLQAADLKLKITSCLCCESTERVFSGALGSKSWISWSLEPVAIRLFRQAIDPIRSLWLLF